jgi:hypothetical protein
LKKNYFTSIDEISLKKWWLCMDGDIFNCRIDVSIEQTEAEDWEAWCIIHDSYLNEFGLSDEYKQIMEIRKRIALLQCDFIIEENNFLRNEIRRLKNELNETLNKNTGIDRDGVMIHLEKWMGFRLNESEITARKFYKIVAEFEKETKKNKG